jgi:nitrate/nitrite transport system substrate-binding protein
MVMKITLATNTVEFADELSALGCACGMHASKAEHDADASVDMFTKTANEDDKIARCVEKAVVKEVFGDDVNRPNFSGAFGAGTAAAAISQFFPMGAAKALAAEIKGPLKKIRLKVGFVPIKCATPIIVANPMDWARHGFYLGALYVNRLF